MTKYVMKTINDLPISNLSPATVGDAFVLVSGDRTRPQFIDRIPYDKLKTYITDDLNARLAFLEQNVTGATATQISALQTAVSQAKASIIEESNVRTSALAAEANYRLALEASFNDKITFTNASVVTEQMARASALEAEALARQTVFAQLKNDLSTVTASVVEESRSRVTAFEALATRITTVEANKTDVDAITGIATTVANAKVADEATARANSDGALATRLQSLETNFITRDAITGIATTVANAKVADEASARSTAVEAVATRLQTVEADYTTRDAVTGIATTIATAKVSSEATARATAFDSLAQRIDSVEAGTGTDVDRVTGIAQQVATATVADEATARTTADEALAVRTSVVESTISTGGNLLPSSTFMSTAGWSQGGLIGSPAPTGVTFGINVAGDLWHPATDNVLGIGQASTGNSTQVMYWYSDTVSVVPGKWYQFSAYIASHRADIGIGYENSNGTDTVSGQPVRVVRGTGQNGGTLIANYDQVYFNIKATYPNMRMQMLKYGTNGSGPDSYAWFLRPQLVEVASANTPLRPYAPAVGSAKANTTFINAKVADEATARSTAIDAVAQRVTTVESAYITASKATDIATTVAIAKVADEATARSTAIDAVASRTTSVESRFGNQSGYANPNVNFSAWPDAATYPSQWRLWNPGTFTRENSQFQSGSYMLGHVVPSTIDSGLYSPIYITDGYWVLEASVWCSAGNQSGAGVLVDNMPPLNFSTEPDINGTVGVGAAGVRNWSVLRKSTYTGAVNIYLMGNYSGIGSTPTAKTLHWLKVAVRPATEGEIKAQKADAALNTPGTGILARLSTEENTRASAVEALAGRSTTLEANFTKINGAPNLLGPINDWTGLTVYSNSGYWGPILQFSATLPDTTSVLSTSPRVTLYPNATYTLSCDLLAVGATNVVANMDVICFDSAGNVVLDSPNTPDLVNADFNDSRAIGAFSTTFNTPANTSYGVVRLLGNSRGVYTVIGARKIKLELGNKATVYNDNTSVVTTNARIATEEKTRADAVSAVASRTSSVESRFGNQASYHNSNPSFSAWQDGAALPSQWTYWNPNYTITRENSGFQNGAYMVGHVVPDANDSGFSTPIYITAGYWVIEASVWCSAGNFQGAGVYIDNLPPLNFSTIADNVGAVGPTGPSVRSWSMLLQTNYTGQCNIYAMGNWGSLGAGSAKTLHWLRVGARPATDGEIKAQKADIALNTPGTGVIARITTEENTRASAVKAVADRTTVVEASVGTGGNLLPSSTFTVGQTLPIPGWNNASSGGPAASFVVNAAGDNWHPRGENAISIIQSGGDASQIAYYVSDLVAVSAGKWYQFSAYIASHRADVGIGYEVYDAANNGQGGGQPIRISRGTGSNGGLDLNGWDRVYFNVQATNTNFRMQILKWGTNPGASDSYGWFIRPQIVEVGNGSAAIQAYRPSSSQANLSASVTTTSSAIADLKGRTSAYWATTAVAGNNRAQLAIRADANGGAGVDIIGDVNITGGNGGARTVISPSLIQVFDTNNVLRVRLGVL